MTHREIPKDPPLPEWLSVGVRIRHPHFGIGTVESLGEHKGYGAVTILFGEPWGRKKLATGIALSIIEPVR
jgi:hypothetical protein